MSVKAAKVKDAHQVSPLAQRLIRQLVAQAAHPGPAVCPHEATEKSDSEGILFTGDVDGVHCVLVKRTPTGLNPATLTPREREIARMIAKGHPNKVIADVLDISVWTVNTHLRRIFAKLHVTSRAAMVAIMAQLGTLI